MIFRVIFHVDTLGSTNLPPSERIFIHECETYRDEDTALICTQQCLGRALLNWGFPDLSDQVSQLPDFASIDTFLKGRFMTDPCHQSAYVLCDNITEPLINHICETLPYQEDVSHDLLRQIADHLGIDIAHF